VRPLRAHSAYKQSGVEWIGQIPAHWQACRTKFVAKLYSGLTPSRDKPEYWVPEECKIPWFTLADVWQLRDGTRTYLGDTTEKISPVGLANSAARLLPPGTVIVSRTASVGFAGIMPHPMATTQDFVNWVCGDHIRPQFLLHVFRAMRGELSRLMMGSTHQTIYMPDVRSFSTPLPPLDEQEEIIAFLDRETARINRLIAKKRRLIELLRDKRQVVISRVVTKGLDPDAPIKNSGIEWLGEIRRIGRSNNSVT
jgi:type I restriction enzyme, S subunit